MHCFYCNKEVEVDGAEGRLRHANDWIHRHHVSKHLLELEDQVRRPARVDCGRGGLQANVFEHFSTFRVSAGPLSVRKAIWIGVYLDEAWTRVNEAGMIWKTWAMRSFHGHSGGSNGVRQCILREIYQELLHCRTYRPNMRLPRLDGGADEGELDMNFWVEVTGAKFQEALRPVDFEVRDFQTPGYVLRKQENLFRKSSI